MTPWHHAYMTMDDDEIPIIQNLKIQFLIGRFVNERHRSSYAASYTMLIQAVEAYNPYLLCIHNSFYRVKVLSKLIQKGEDGYMPWERRYLVHARCVELMVMDADRRKHEIDADDPRAEEKRNQITEQLRQDVREFSSYFFGRKTGDNCVECPYGDYYYQRYYEHVMKESMGKNEDK